MDASGGPRTVDLTVKVVLPNNRPAGQNIGVALESVYGGVVNQYVTNNEGEVTFHNLHSGSYVLRVTGADIKDTSSHISIQPSDNRRMEYVRVEPLQPNGTNTVPSTQGSVSAASLNIPYKAEKEFNKGNEAFVRGDAAKATEYYLKAIEIYPKYAMAYSNLGTAYMKSADKTRAREAWTKALAIDPNLDAANADIAKLSIIDHDYTSAIVPLEKALTGQPRNPEFLFLMSEAQFMAENYEKALIYARKVCEVEHHQYEMAHLVAGRALEAQNHPDQARVEYENLLKESPTAPEAAEAKKSLARLDSQSKAH